MKPQVLSRAVASILYVNPYSEGRPSQRKRHQRDKYNLSDFPPAHLYAALSNGGQPLFAT